MMFQDWIGLGWIGFGFGLGLGLVGGACGPWWGGGWEMGDGRTCALDGTVRMAKKTNSVVVRAHLPIG